MNISKGVGFLFTDRYANEVALKPNVSFAIVDQKTVPYSHSIYKEEWYPYVHLKADETFVGEIFPEIGKSKRLFVTIEDVGLENGDFFAGLGDELEKAGTVLHIIGTKEEFTGSHPSKLILKKLLDEYPKFVVACVLSQSVDSFTDVAAKPIVKRAFENQGFKMAAVYVLDTQLAIELIEFVELSIIWNQAGLLPEFATRLRSLGQRVVTPPLNLPAQYESASVMQILTGPLSTDIPVRNAIVPTNFKFTVYEIVDREGKQYGKIKASLERWVVLRDENMNANYALRQ